MDDVGSVSMSISEAVELCNNCYNSAPLFLQKLVLLQIRSRSVVRNKCIGAYL